MFERYRREAPGRQSEWDERTSCREPSSSEAWTGVEEEAGGDLGGGSATAMERRR